MSSTGHKNLTVKEVNAMLKICNQTGVRMLSYQGLVVSFGDGRPQWEEQSSIKSPRAVAAADGIDQRTLEQTELETKEQQVAELVLTDPSAYERLLENEELEDVGNDENGQDDQV